jgi:putative MATE family efflux protein
MARQYLDVILLGLPVTLVFMVVASVFQGSGDTRTPFWILGGSLLVNAALDPLLVFGWGPVPAMGLGGAALATVASQALGAVPGIALLARRRMIALGRPPLGLRSLSILRIGVPSFLEGFLFCVVYVVLVRLLVPYGVPALAALGVGHRLEGIGYMFALGFARASAALVGQNLGAGRPARAARGAWLAAGVASAFALLMTAAFLAVPHALVALFVPEAGTVAEGGTYLRIVAISQVFMVVEVTLSGAFEGAGDTLPPMIVSASLTAARIPLAYLLATEMGMGASGIYWAISATTVLKGILMAAWFLLGRWREARVEEPRTRPDGRKISQNEPCGRDGRDRRG